MKNIKIFVLVAFVALINYSCEDDKDLAVLDNAGAVASTLVTPADGSSIVLNKAQGAEEFEAITWTQSDYGAVLPCDYTIQLDASGSSFADPIKLIKTVDLTYSATNAAINLFLYNGGAVAGTPTDAYFRIMTTVKNDLTDTLFSEANKVSITTFEYNKPVVTEPSAGKSFVLTLANAEKNFDAIKWEKVDYGDPSIVNIASLQVALAGTNFSDFEVVSVIAEDNFYVPTVSDLNKVLTKLGLDPGVATDVEFRVVGSAGVKSGVVEGEGTAYTITTYDADAGPTDPTDEYPETLILVGDATDAGWDASSTITMTRVESGVYTLVTNLKAGDGIEGYKFLVEPGKWEPMYAQDGNGTWEGGTIMYRAPGEPDITAFPAPPTTGSYLIEIDLPNMTYKVTAQ